MSERQAQLDYGHQAALWKRRWVRNCVVGVALLIGTFVIGYRLGLPIYNRTRLLYWQRQCLRYTAPPDKIVYEDDPEAAAKLLGHGYTQLSETIGPGFDPVAVDEGSLKCWNRFADWDTAFPVLFLHERSKNGVRRLVAVYLRRGWDDTTFGGFCGEVLSASPQPGEGKASQFLDFGSIPQLYTREEREGPHLRFYAGQPDPADDSHFTIVYDLGGKKGTIDGWLRDPPSIELRVRDGPAKSQTSAP